MNLRNSRFNRVLGIVGSIVFMIDDHGAGGARFILIGFALLVMGQNIWKYKELKDE